MNNHQDNIDRVELTVEVLYRDGRRVRKHYPNVQSFQNITEGNHLHWEGDIRPLWEKP